MLLKTFSVIGVLFTTICINSETKVDVKNSPDNIQIFNTPDPTYVRISWSPPKQTNGQITGYYILYSNDNLLNDRKWKKQKKFDKETTMMLTGLTPYIKYYVKVKAIIDNIFSTPSDVIEFETKSVNTDIPQSPKIIGVSYLPSSKKESSSHNLFDIEIMWQAPKNYLGKIEQYEIYYSNKIKLKGLELQMIIVNKIDGYNDINNARVLKYKIPDLLPNTKYEFVVKVKTSEENVDKYSSIYYFKTMSRDVNDQNNSYLLIATLSLAAFIFFIIYFYFDLGGRQISQMQGSNKTIHNEIDKADLSFKEIPIGLGRFSKVYYGRYKGTIDVAVKMIIKGQMSFNDYLKEVEMLSLCSHDKLIKMYGASYKDEDLLIVTEFVRNGSLSSYLYRLSGTNSLALREFLNMCTQVADGMSYLESINVVHRDLAARNILVGGDNLIKIADLGLARVTNSGKYYEPEKGEKIPNGKWTAPETILSGKYCSRADVWSYGVLLYEMVTFGREPYEGMSYEEVQVKVTTENYRLPKPTIRYCPDKIYDKMLECWNKDPSNRPSFDELYQFFSDFEKLH